MVMWAKLEFNWTISNRAMAILICWKICNFILEFFLTFSQKTPSMAIGTRKQVVEDKWMPFEK